MAALEALSISSPGFDTVKWVRLWNLDSRVAPSGAGVTDNGSEPRVVRSSPRVIIILLPRAIWCNEIRIHAEVFQVGILGQEQRNDGPEVSGLDDALVPLVGIWQT